jgi:hypothetical protein
VVLQLGGWAVREVFRYFDTHDIAGLIAPHPLLVEMGVHDTCFYTEDQPVSYERLRKIYEAAGVGEDLWADMHPGEHGFAANKAYEFFGKYL